MKAWVIRKTAALLRGRRVIRFAMIGGVGAGQQTGQFSGGQFRQAHVATG
ncbi:hypothetical protein [Deinococcus saxicola]